MSSLFSFGPPFTPGPPDRLAAPPGSSHTCAINGHQGTPSMQGLTTVGGVPIQRHHLLRCHCGAVVLRLHLPDGVVSPRRCDCSMCRRRGAIVASVKLADLEVVQGHDVLRLYQFNTHVARHHFCSVCGIYTHHQRRSSPDEYGYNVGCLDGVNPFDIGEVPVSDGVNHPSDATRA